MNNYYLSFQSISKSFPGVQALKDISFDIKKGSVHGLVGENGAGKSTLIKILSGYYQQDFGDIVIDKHKTKFSSPFSAIHNGINVIHQELNLVPNQTVAENIFLGYYASRSGFVSWKKLFQEARKFLDFEGIDIDERKKVSELTIGQQQLVEIAKAIKRDANIIAFDEPTSSLSKYEVDILFRIIRELKKKNKAIIYISHRMAEVFELCDACTVFKDGQHVVTHDSINKSLTREQLIMEMTGKEIKNIYDYTPREIGDIVLHAENIQGPGVHRPCSIHVRKGEIVGLFGLVGAGRSELAKLIYNNNVAHAGTISIDHTQHKLKTIKHAINHGIMYCTEDRKKEGIINNRPVWENINISCRRHFSLLGSILRLSQEKENANFQVNSLNIKTPSLSQNIINLSGGNQQKVILARWLSEKGLRVLLIDEPTRGIDVGAKNEIYNILYALAEKGVGIIMISSELPEIVGVSDRIYIMREGEISKEMNRDEFEESLILEHAFPKEQKTT